MDARSILVSPNFSGRVKRLYECRPVKVICSSNISMQKACNVSSDSKLVKRLTSSKLVCPTIVSKGNICNARIVSQHVNH